MNERTSKRMTNVGYNDSNQWSSTRFIPFSENQVFNNRYYNTSITSNTEQVIDTAIHNWRLRSTECDQRVHEFGDKKRYEFRADSRKCVKRGMDWSEDRPTKRPKIYNSYNRSHSGTQDIRPNCGKESNLSSNDVSIALICKSCDVLSHSFLDFSSHLKGKRHKNNLGFCEQSKQTTVCHKLQQLLDQSIEPIVGLDFIKEVKSKGTEDLNRFDCILCDSRQLSVSSVLRHITRFRHRYEFAKLIEPNKRQILKPFVSKEVDNHFAHSLALKYESLYGRGNCQFMTKNCSTRAQNTTTSCSVSASSSAPKTSDTTLIKSNALNVEIDLNKKVVEAFESIRRTCDQMIAYYSTKQKFGESTSKANGLTGTDPKQAVSHSAPTDANRQTRNDCNSIFKDIITVKSIKSEK